MNGKREKIRIAKKREEGERKGGGVE